MAKQKLNAPLGATLVVVSSVFYASYGIWTTLMGNFFGGYTASALRSVLVLLMIVPAAASVGQLRGFQIGRHWRYWAAALAASLLMWGPFYYAILHAGIGVALAVNYAVFIVGTFVLAWVFLRERFSKDKWVATGLSLVGLYFLFTPNLARIGWVALGAACLSGVSFGAINVVLKSAPYGVMKSNLMLWVASTVANAVMAVLVGEHWPAAGWHMEWVYLGLFALCSIAASLTYIRGIKLIEAGAAGILGLLEVVFGVVFGIVLFGQPMKAVELVGIALILAAAAIPYLKDYNAARGSFEGLKK